MTMTLWLSAGILFTLTAITYIVLAQGHRKIQGQTPVKTFTFAAILFTSGLDVSLIMFPLTEFANYADVNRYPEYAFTNPLAIEFGFWGFWVWSIYFLTCFYFCVLEPKVKFFEIAIVKRLNTLVIIGTCAFTAFLLLSNLPWYLPSLAKSTTPIFYVIVFVVIGLAVVLSSKSVYLARLRVTTTWLFIALIAGMGLYAYNLEHNAPQRFWQNLVLLSDYFANLHKFVFPINEYHEFYLLWWFAWSIMIGQFTASFVGGLKTYQLLLAMIVFPSIPIAAWFAVLYHYHQANIATTGIVNLAMVFVGILFAINSLDSLIRLYTNNLGLTVKRLGKHKYLLFNVCLLTLLTLLFQLDFLKIQWLGAVVIAIFFVCFAFALKQKLSSTSPTNYPIKPQALTNNKTEYVN